MFSERFNYICIELLFSLLLRLFYPQLDSCGVIVIEINEYNYVHRRGLHVVNDELVG